MSELGTRSEGRERTMAVVRVGGVWKDECLAYEDVGEV